MPSVRESVRMLIVSSKELVGANCLGAIRSVACDQRCLPKEMQTTPEPSRGR
jgi:hypothetical protein